MPNTEEASFSIDIKINRRGFATKVLLGGLTAASCIAFSGSAFALFTNSDENQAAQVDHAIWDQIVKRYVFNSADGINRVNYENLKKTGSKSLKAYLKILARTPVSKYNRDEQFAYWVNLYNALTLKVIVDAYPVTSIKSIGGVFGFGGPWKAKRFTVEGQEISLDDIEHNILRANWREPRIHYAVNCASIGCPNLQREAFTRENTQRLLNKGAVEYINSTRGADVRNGRLQVSSIYVWFKADFGGSDQGVVQHMRTYAQPQLQQALSQVSSISSNDYDWNLNDTKQ